MSVDPDAWRGGVSITHAVTPMHVRIENQSGEKLAIRYRHFAMLGESGERFAALPPYEIRGTVAGVGPARRYPPINRLGFTYEGFTFRAEIVDIVSGETMGSVTIPFVVQTGEAD